MATMVIDKEGIAAVERTLSILKLGSADAIRFATNDALKGIRTEASRLVREQVNLAAKIVNQHFIINKMFPSNMSADITCSGEPLPLIHYGASQTNKGVTLKVLKKGTRKLLRHAFIAEMESTHVGVFWRTAKRRTLGGKNFKPGVRMKLPSPEKRSGEQILKGEGNFQLPIHELYGPRVPDVFDDPGVMNPTLEDADTRFSDRLDYHTERLLDKARQA